MHKNWPTLYRIELAGNWTVICNQETCVYVNFLAKNYLIREAGNRVIDGLTFKSSQPGRWRQSIQVHLSLGPNIGFFAAT